jgi:RimJ/RimL family protein N-acetyltransferase
MKLRTIENTDLESIRGWRNSQIDVLRQYKPITYNEQQEYFNNLHKDSKQILFAIENKKLIGYCGLVNINYVYSTAEISFIADTYIKKSAYETAFTFVLQELSNIAFNSLNLNKLWTETYEFRKDHINILESCKFIKDGTLREHVYKNGKRYDSIIHSLLKKEYINEHI